MPPKSELKSLLDSRDYLMSRIRRIDSEVETLVLQGDKIALQIHLEWLRELYGRFEKVQMKLEALDSALYIPEGLAAETLYLGLLNSITAALYEVEQKIENGNHGSPQANSRANPGLALPHISLPTFSELYTEWPSHLSKAPSSAKVETKFERKAFSCVGVESKGKVSCEFCSGTHFITKCYKFLQLGFAKRRKTVEKSRLCFNCLGGGHIVAKCSFNKAGCKVCDKKHHSLLHRELDKLENNEATTDSDKANGGKEEVGSEMVAAHVGSNMQCLEVSSSKEMRSISSGSYPRVLLSTSATADSDKANGGKEEVGSEKVAAHVGSSVQCLEVSSSNEMGSISSGSSPLVLLSTAVLNVEDDLGNKFPCRALLDSGSERNFITREFVRKLRISERISNWEVSGIGGQVTPVNGLVNLLLSSRVGNFEINSKFGVLDRITENLPRSNFKRALIKWQFNVSSPIDMLIGAELFDNLMLKGKIDLGTGSLVLQNTKLGWIFGGAVDIGLKPKGVSVYHASMVVSAEEDLNDTVVKFWKTEEFAPKVFLSSEEKNCEKIVVESVTRDVNGRYEVDLPIDEAKLHTLGDSYDYVLRCFLSLERRFKRDPELFLRYQRFIHEFLELGHAHEIRKFLSAVGCEYYLPHHAVLKEDSSTTKLRVVFNASVKSLSGVSLHKIMIVGTVVQPDLFAALLRFRTYIYGFKVKEKYRSLQRILLLLLVLLREVKAGSEKKVDLRFSKLRFLDQNEVLRVGGRLQYCGDSVKIQKYPIIISDQHHVVTLLIRFEHERLLHVGPQATLSSLRQSFWIVGGRNATRKCFRFTSKSSEQFMANLPSVRVTPSRSFLHAGLDYAGPIIVKQSRMRKAVISKGYICLFICMDTKAVHLELVSDMSTKAFLAALSRFFCRRGKSAQLFSDNGTNFKGAYNELNELCKLFANKTSSEIIVNSMTKEGVTWNFIPPSSPHWGGLWEAGVKGVKHHLKRILGNALFTYEELNTLLVQIEGVLNSRPLCPLGNEPEELECLTPAHFLINENLTNLPEANFLDIPVNRLSVWEHIKKLKQLFWKRWQQEYLHALHQRYKWHEKTDKIVKGAVVLIREDGVPPLQWCVGRIIDVFHGKDGHVQSVLLKTKSGEYHRPITKISPLLLYC